MMDLGRLPKGGEIIDLGRFHFQVLRADNRRIHLLEMTLRDPPATEPESPDRPLPAHPLPLGWRAFCLSLRNAAMFIWPTCWFSPPATCWSSPPARCRFRAVRPLAAGDPAAGRAALELGGRHAAPGRPARRVVRTGAVRFRHLLDFHQPARLRRRSRSVRGAGDIRRGAGDGAVSRRRRRAAGALGTAAGVNSLAAGLPGVMDPAGLGAKLAVHRLSLAGGRLQSDRCAPRPDRPVSGRVRRRLGGVVQRRPALDAAQWPAPTGERG